MDKLPDIKINVLVIEDEIIFADVVKKYLEKKGFAVNVVHELAAARDLLNKITPSIILLDMRLPDGSGLDLLSTLQSNHKLPVPVLVMSAYGELEDAVSAMKLGAADYLRKPIDLDELLIAINKVLEQDVLSRRLEYSTKREQHAIGGVEFLGECSAVEEVKTHIAKIADLSYSAESIPPTVLILGETGTGKDVVARMLHANSARSAKPFLHVDCAALPKELIESELFGHEKGAFTSAYVSRVGLLEAAEDGVLFLDEVGELPLVLQSKLLTVLERRILRRVGSSVERPVAAWLIAATHQPLENMVQDGRFRADLYYRLNVLSLSIPPLRERGDDIRLLAENFVAKSAKHYGVSTPSISNEAMARLCHLPWRGNVRELKNVLERAVLLSGGKSILPDMFGGSAIQTVAPPVVERVSSEEAPSSGVAESNQTSATLQETEIAMIKEVLAKAGNNVSKAARELGITRMALRYRIDKYNL